MKNDTEVSLIIDRLSHNLQDELDYNIKGQLL